MKKNVLIIDDEEDICFLLGKMLREKGFTVNVAHSLAEGIEKLTALKPEILFLDIHLPDGSGLDKVFTIRSFFPQMKIIMMSAYDSSKERGAADEEGADVFIGKPLSNELITQTLKRIGFEPEKINSN
jgi:DNA-binding response OmpR family regulator